MKHINNKNDLYIFHSETKFVLFTFRTHPIFVSEIRIHNPHFPILRQTSIYYISLHTQ